MLLLRRSLNERIQIGEDIDIRIIARRGNTVLVGIQAPPHIRVDRYEVYQERLAQLQKPAASKKSRGKAND